MPKTGRPLSTKTLALRTLNDPVTGSATKFVALQVARPHLSLEEYGKQLRQLAAVARSKVLRLCFVALAGHETEERTRNQMQASAGQRAEIDRILMECAREQGVQVAAQPAVEVEGQAGGPKPIPKSVEPIAVGAPPAPPSVPVDGVSSEAPEQPAHAAVRIPDLPDDSESKRGELLAQGRALAASVLVQYERFTRCPHNQQEVHRLDALTAQFLEWERQAHIQFPEIDTLKEFPDARLRPVQKVPFHGDYYRTFRFYKNMLTFDEQQAIALQHEQTKREQA